MEALGIDGKLIIAQLVNFAIFFLIFKKFIAKPLASYLKKQDDEEKKRHSLSCELEDAKVKLEEEKQKLLKETKDQQKKLIDEAKVYSEGLKIELMEQSKKDAAEIITAGRQALQEERAQVEKELAESMRKAAQIALMNGLSGFLTEKTRKELTEEIIENVK